MAAPPRTAIAGTFFITAITYNRGRLFQVEARAKLFIETLQHYRAEGLYKLYAFVVMPDHVHLLLTTDDLPKAMQHIKGGFSRRVDSKVTVWQRGFTDHLVLNREHFESRRRYIHENPVRERLVESAEKYPYSSAFRG
jgi:putative transposase